MNGLELVEAARLAETYGDGTVRIGTDQNITLTGVPEDRIDDLLAEDLLQKYSPYPGPFTRGVVACTGSEFCRYAIVETKERAVKWARFLDEQLAGEPVGAAPSRAAGRARARTPASSACTSPAARPAVPSPRSPTSDSGARWPTWATTCPRRSTSAWAGRSGPTPGSSTGSSTPDRSTTCPTPCCGWSAATSRSAGQDEPFYNWARRIPNDDLRRTLAEEGTGTPVTLATKPARTVAPG